MYSHYLNRTAAAWWCTFRRYRPPTQLTIRASVNTKPTVFVLPLLIENTIKPHLNIQLQVRCIKMRGWKQIASMTSGKSGGLTSVDGGDSPGRRAAFRDSLQNRHRCPGRGEILVGRKPQPNKLLAKTQPDHNPNKLLAITQRLIHLT
jgi:hypothetical protein